MVYFNFLITVPLDHNFAGVQNFSFLNFNISLSRFVLKRRISRLSSICTMVLFWSSLFPYLFFVYSVRDSCSLVFVYLLVSCYMVSTISFLIGVYVFTGYERACAIHCASSFSLHYACLLCWPRTDSFQTEIEISNDASEVLYPPSLRGTRKPRAGICSRGTAVTDHSIFLILKF